MTLKPEIEHQTMQYLAYIDQEANGDPATFAMILDSVRIIMAQAVIAHPGNIGRVTHDTSNHKQDEII